jgi:hypothetical protein
MEAFCSQYQCGCRRFQEGPHETHAVCDQEQDDDEHIGGNKNNISNNIACYSSHARDMCMAETFTTSTGCLPTEWILLDSSSTTDIISDPNLIHGIHHAEEPIWIGPIAGWIKLSNKGYLGNYPHPVWYNPNGAANILSLFNMSRSYRVTMDTRLSQAIQVHMKDGSTINFKPTRNGLWVHHINNPQYVQNMWLMLSTSVQKNSSTYNLQDWLSRHEQTAMAANVLNIWLMDSPAFTIKHDDRGYVGFI